MKDKIDFFIQFFLAIIFLLAFAFAWTVYKSPSSIEEHSGNLTSQRNQTNTVPEKECGMNLENAFLLGYFKPIHVKNALNFKSAEQAKVEGGSIEPFVYDGNTVLLQKFDNLHVEEGNLIVYNNEEDKEMVHKVDAVYRHEPEPYVVVLSKYGLNETVPFESIEDVVIGVLYT